VLVTSGVVHRFGVIGFDLVPFAAAETVECLIHVKTLTDAILDDIGDYSARHSIRRAEHREAP